MYRMILLAAVLAAFTLIIINSNDTKKTSSLSNDTEITTLSRSEMSALRGGKKGEIIRCKKSSGRCMLLPEKSCWGVNFSGCKNGSESDTKKCNYKAQKHGQVVCQCPNGEKEYVDYICVDY